MALQVGDRAPDFTMPTVSGGTVSLDDLRGKKVVLYFYPKDDTPGCTIEACSFRDNLPNFQGANAEVIGVSRDNTESHQAFRDKYGLNFTLASDDTGEVTEAFGVWREKNMYGKTFMGIQRSTFLIDENGNIAKIWPSVSVEGHSKEVLAAINGEEASVMVPAEPKAPAAPKVTAMPKAAPKKAAAKPKAKVAAKPKMKAKAAAKSTRKAPAKKAAAKKTAKKPARKAAAKASKKPAKKTAKKAAKKATKKAVGRKPAKKAASKPAKRAAARPGAARRTAARRPARRTAARRRR
jgi:peroxiredoxin Q/BCP